VTGEQKPQEHVFKWLGDLAPEMKVTRHSELVFVVHCPRKDFFFEFMRAVVGEDNKQMDLMVLDFGGEYKVLFTVPADKLSPENREKYDELMKLSWKS